MSNEALKVGELPPKLTGAREQYLSFEKSPAGAFWMDRDLTCHGRGGPIRPSVTTVQETHRSDELRRLGNSPVSAVSDILACAIRSPRATEGSGNTGISPGRSHPPPRNGFPRHIRTISIR